MRVLFTSWYCPNEDNHGVEVKLTPFVDALYPQCWRWEGQYVRLHLYKQNDPFLGTYVLIMCFGNAAYPGLPIYLNGNTQEELNETLQGIREQKVDGIPYDNIDCTKLPSRITWEL